MDDWARRRRRRRRRGTRSRARVGGRAAADPRRSSRARRAARGGVEPGDGRRARTSTPSGAWDAAVALAERQRLPVWATPPPGGGRLGFPEGHPNFRGSLPPGHRPAGRDARAARPRARRRAPRSSPTTRTSPAPLLAEGTELVAITSDPDEAARAPMGEAIVADVRLTLEALARRASARRPTASAPSRWRARGRRGDRPALRRRWSTRRSAEVFPDDGIVVLESPSSARSRFATSCASRAPAATTSAPAAASASASRPSIGVQLAQPDRPVVCVLGEGSVQYAVTGFWSAAAYDVPVTFLVLRNSEYAILKWFGSIEQVSGAPGLDLPEARLRRGRRRLRRAVEAGRRPRGAARGARRGDRAPTARGSSRSRWRRAWRSSSASAVALADAKLERIAPPAVPAGARPRAGLGRGGTPAPLRADLEALVGAEQRARAPDRPRPLRDRRQPVPARSRRRSSLAHDAGDVAQRSSPTAARTDVPVTLRGGGTSLNGQGQGDGILVDVRRHFGGVAVEDGGARARVGPGNGARPRQPRARAARPQARPRPGEHRHRDRRRRRRQQLGRHALRRRPRLRTARVRSMTFVLPSGTTIDTAADGAEERFARGRAGARGGPGRDPRGDPAPTPSSPSGSAASSRSRTRPATASAPSSTPRRRSRSSGACSSAPRGRSRSWPRSSSRPSRCRRPRRLVDPLPLASRRRPSRCPGSSRPGATRRRADGRSVADRGELQHPGTPGDVAASCHRVGGAARGARRRRRRRARRGRAGGDRDPRRPRAASRRVDFTRDHERIEMSWRVREGMHGLLGKLSPPEAALIVEDVCVPPARIAECARDLQALLGEHGFLPGVAGHASAGNLHFMLTPDFAKPEDTERYEALMGKVVELILDKYDGSLKAEHGTGVNMAPFVEREWGEKATELMWRVKELADPDGVLDAGRAAEPRPGLPPPATCTRTRRSRRWPTSCVECGFCEPVCPSREPDDDAAPANRHPARDRPPARGVAGRRGAPPRLRARRDRHLRRRRQLRARVPGRHRHRQAREGAPRAAAQSARVGGAWRSPSRSAGRAVERAARGGLRVGHAIAASPATHPSAARRGRLGAPPGRSSCRSGARECPEPARGELPVTSREGAAAVYVPACINRIFGRARGRRPGRRAGAGRGLAPRGDAGVDPARRRRALLRNALELEGLRGRTALDGPPHLRGPLALERRRAAAARDRRVLVHPRGRAGDPRRARRGERRAPPPARGPRRRGVVRAACSTRSSRGAPAASRSIRRARRASSG